MLLSRQVQSRKLRSKGAHRKKTSSFTNVHSERASSSPQSPHNKTGLMQIPPPSRFGHMSHNPTPCSSTRWILLMDENYTVPEDGMGLELPGPRRSVPKSTIPTFAIRAARSFFVLRWRHTRRFCRGDDRFCAAMFGYAARIGRASIPNWKPPLTRNAKFVMKLE